MLRAFLLPICLLLAAAAQMLGPTGTCTMGDTDSWLVGALFSLPFLLVILLLAALTLALRNARWRLLEAAAYAFTAAGATLLTLSNAGLLATILVDGASACGADFGRASREDVLIALVHALPLLAAVLCTAALMKLLQGGSPEKRRDLG